jgi:hypothetical protein
MPRPPNNKAITNEIRHPYIVEVAVVSDGLDAELCRRIMQFHKSRHIEPRYARYGRRIATRQAKSVIVGALPIY